MAPLDIDTVLAWRGRTVRDANGERIGTFGDVFLESDSDAPAWGGVKTGLFGRHESFVPLSAVREVDDEVLVPFTADEVKAAPRVDPDVALSAEEEDQLYAHYGQGQAQAPTTTPGPDVGATAAATGSATTSADAEVAPASASAPAPVDGPQVHDDAAEVTRSEEEVRVAPGEMRPKERVRLRKVLVTEHVEQTVPVRKEVVQLETEPPPPNAVEER
jgi:hypothetical protein